MKNLKKTRLEKGFTQKALCEELKKYGYSIAQNTYSQYETGKHDMPAEVFAQICWIFNTSSDYILGLREDAAPLYKDFHTGDS